MPEKRLIKAEDRKVTTLKAGEHTINGLLVVLKEDTEVVFVEEHYLPEYMTKYKPLQHDPNGSAGAGRFSKFRW